MKRTSARLVTIAAALTFLGDDCKSSLVEDPGFTVWRSDTELAAWKVTAGRIQKSPTWSDAEPGVDFLDVPTEIVQEIKPTGDCAEIEVMGKIEGAGNLTLSYGTNVVSVPDLDWTTHKDYVRLNGRYVTERDGGSTTRGWAADNIRLRRTGPGRVLLSRIKVVSATACQPDQTTPP